MRISARSKVLSDTSVAAKKLSFAEAPFSQPNSERIPLVTTLKHIPFICIFLLSTLRVTGQDFIFHKQSYSVEDGLPHREVNAVYQCRRGFVWVGTPQGLSRFDGYQFQTFNTRTDHFLHDNIWRILEDAEGWFWLLPIPPYEDFDIWNPVTRELTTFSEKFGPQQTVPTAHPAGWVIASTDQTLLAKLTARDIFTYHPDRGVKVVELKETELFDYQTSSNFGRSLIAAGPSIWIFTADHRMMELDWEGRPLRHFRHSNLLQFNRSIQSDAFPFVYFDWDTDKYAKKRAFMIDRTGEQRTFPANYWYPSLLPTADVQSIGEDILYDDFSFYNVNGDLIYSLPNRQINEATSTFRACFLTQQGDLWTGDDFGLQRISIRKNPFQNHLQSGEGNRNAIRGIYADEEKIILNVEPLGPAIIDRATGQVKQLDFSEQGFGNQALFKLRDGRFAFGQSRGLGLMDRQGLAVGRWPIGTYPWAIFQISENTLWLGTENGLRVFDLTKKAALPFGKYNGFDDLRTAHITHIAASRNGHIWLCTNKGFFEADRERGIISQYSKNGEGPFQIPHDVVYHFYEDADGTFWLATGGGGLIQLAVGNKDNQSPNSSIPQFPDSPVHQFTTLDGLSNDVIYAVYPDGKGNLWLSSDQGIMRFHQKTGEVQTFLTADGLPNNEFNRLAHFRAADGELFFGTINGGVSFHPSELPGMTAESDPPLRITAYQQFDGKENRMVERTAGLLINREIVLHPDDRFFRLELALLNFNDVSKNRYAYRFTGMGDEWEYTSERTLRFGRLPYGKYELQIKAQDARGHWSASQLRLPVTVLRPFYLQVWFIVLAIVALLAGAFLFFKIRTRQLRERQRELEKTVGERTRKIQEDKAVIEKQAEELQSLERLKSRFFANVSHELRTPLTLMIGPLDSILKKETDRPKKERKLLEFVRNNSQHLLKLVNEILDLSKMETGRLEVCEEAVNFREYLQPMLSQFRSFSDSESVRLHFEYRADPDLHILLDTGKFEKIIHNFLSNALKFTPAGGRVELVVQDEVESLLVSVHDTGPGIHPDDLPHIFDRFYQSQQPDAPVQGGTGIGLSLAAELAALLEGKVWAESPDSYRNGKGSVFYFQFPKKVVTGDGGLVTGSTNGTEEKALELTETTEPSAVPVSAQSPITDHQSPKTTVLVVEDNPELRAYLEVLLEDDYHVLTAENGRAALDMLEASSELTSHPAHPLTPLTGSPSLIISDLMMPVMDGFQFLEKIKSDNRFRHLPVIMLTARADVRVKLRALRIGVDDYLTKPFVEEELKIRIQNLLANYHERLLATAALAEPGEVQRTAEQPVIAAADAEWLEAVEAVFSKTMGDSQFKLDWVASEMHLSERQFNRRLKQLTGLTPNHYLREMRLQQARDFLHEGRYTSVKEVGSAVGFSSTKYFSKLFQERFGVLPSEYLA
ncbi:MAG: response regulator [Lewinellaceae bacterium]|nr:response regulator [Lewinellaceae bacterium]